MGSVEWATKRIGTLIKALFRKYIRCLSVSWFFKFMDTSVSHELFSLLLCLLPQNIPTYLFTYPLFLARVEEKPESTLLIL